MKTKKKIMIEREIWALEKELYQTAKPYHDACVAYTHAEADWEDRCESIGIGEKLIEEIKRAVHRRAGQDAIRTFLDLKEN